MSDNIFEGATTPVAEPQSSSPALQIPTEVAELVGEGKKYKSVEDALKSVPHAQTHIQRLEDEAKQLREELERRKSAEELLESVRSGITPAPVAQPTTTAAVNTESVEQTVSKILAEKEAQKTAKENINKVVSTFQSTFGDKAKAEEVYNRVAAEAGLSVQMLNTLAATSPEAVLKLAGITGKATVPAGKPNSTVNTQVLSQGGQQELSAKVPMGATTKDLVNAWRIAGEKVKQKLNQ